MKKKDNIWTKWIYWFTLVVAAIFIYKTLDNYTQITNWFGTLFGILMPFLCGILIAYLLYIPSRKVERLYEKIKIKWLAKKARTLSVLTIYIIAIGIIVLAIKFVVPAISQSLIDFANNIQNYYSKTMDNINQLPEDSIFKSQQAKELIGGIQNIDFKQFINMEKLAGYAKGVMNVASSIFDIFVAFIVSIYILIERREILIFFRKLIGAVFNKKISHKMGEYFNQTNQIFFRFLASQFLDAIVVGTLVSIAMSLLGVKYAILLGVMIGLFNLIPYFGAIIAVAVAILVTLLTGGLTQAIWMAIIVIVLQQIDANIINPKIVGSSLKISPILVIFAVTVGGAYFGILGMFLAVPVVAVIKILVGDFIEFRNRKKKSIEETQEKEEIDLDKNEK